MIDERPGLVYCQVAGEGAWAWFKHEAGGHRWQRVPPTEKRGRVHSSTVTVVVLEPAKAAEVSLARADLEEKFVRGTGPGGQHRNKTSTAVVLRHKPTGQVVRVDGGRSQHVNRQTALALLQARMAQAAEEEAALDRVSRRKQQAGSGMRGDKIRTVQVQSDSVVDHRRGTRMSYRNYARGQLEGLLAGGAERP
ncbi:MAG: PCRF domain-containing protein [Myxococcales bacterium]|nr:PCRF domain-containing protein [Myxococcales bacterium]